MVFCIAKVNGHICMIIILSHSEDALTYSFFVPYRNLENTAGFIHNMRYIYYIHITIVYMPDPS